MFTSLRFVFLVTFLLTLAACQVSPETAARIGSGLNGAVTVIDRNGDGILTNGELRDVTNPNNPMNWLQLIGWLGGLFGVPIGVAAARRASATQAQVDDLYDATHTPLAKKPV